MSNFITIKIKNKKGEINEALVPIDKAPQFAMKLCEIDPACWEFGKIIYDPTIPLKV